MSKPYSQLSAMLAITRASLRSIFKSPQAVFFSLFFPIVLIMIFGALTGSGGKAYDVAFDAKSDVTSDIYFAIRSINAFDIHEGSEAELLDQLKKGRITALIEIRQLKATSGPLYDIHLKTTSASQRDLPAVQALLKSFINEAAANSIPSKIAEISVEEIPGRPYRMIDFYLPGMLGFSLIGSAVFGVAFVFFTLRETQVLKRMFATPVRKTFIVLGESLGRVAFLLATSIFLILFGTFFYHFTLANGWITFFEMLIVVLLGTLVFMGAGFVISSVSKNQNVIPIYSNLFMFPQYFLSGTFFPKNVLPAGMQWLIEALPLTALNDALRKISFEGSHLIDCGKQIGILTIWGIIVYVIAIKVFKWE